MAHASNFNAYATPSGRPGVFARLRDSIATHRKFRETLEKLTALNDRELADIGLSRLNVRDVAYKAAYGD